MVTYEQGYKILSTEEGISTPGYREVHVYVCDKWNKQFRIYIYIFTNPLKATYIFLICTYNGIYRKITRFQLKKSIKTVEFPLDVCRSVLLIRVHI